MKKLLYLFLTVLIVGCSGDDENNNQSSCNGDNPVYLADNGVTIKACDFASVGDTGVIDGVTYTVVDETMLREMIDNQEDVTIVVTTKVTDMETMFYDEDETFSDFNQDISNWDVSNVTNMRGMFQLAYLFNQPIGDWDVSNVTDMRAMFNFAEDFNQPIGDWDVSNVTDMRAMFLYAISYNQPIGDWDVSSVTDMEKMFNDTIFNQDIGSWDVSSLNYMNKMFYFALAFNQDLSSWNVDNVTSCSQFSDGANSWTLPQPNFTNCIP